MPTTIDTGAQLDHRALAKHLSRLFHEHPPMEFLDGKTVIRDAVMDRLGCSAYRAEEIVDELISHGLLHYEGEPDRAPRERGAWAFHVGDAT